MTGSSPARSRSSGCSTTARCSSIGSCSGFDDRREHAQLMHIATDGESYGHHHAHGDMALAYVLHRLAQHPEIRLTNYGEFLELHPPEWEVEIHEKTAWSCATASSGGTRTAAARPAATGTRSGAGRSAGRSTSSRTSSTTSSAPGAASASPIPGRRGTPTSTWSSTATRRRIRHFLRRHGHPDLDDDPDRRRPPAARDAAQRDAHVHQLRLVLRRDQRAGDDPVPPLRGAGDPPGAGTSAATARRSSSRRSSWRRATCRSSSTAGGSGSNLIRPAMVDLDRSWRNAAISLIYPDARRERPALLVRPRGPRPGGPEPGPQPPGRRPAPVRSRPDLGRWPSRPSSSSTTAASTSTRSSARSSPTGSTRASSIDSWRRTRPARWPTSRALVTREFEGKVHRLDDLFVDEQRRIIGIVLQDRIEDYQRTFERLLAQDDDVLNRLGQMHYPIPKPLRAAASSYLDLESAPRSSTGWTPKAAWSGSGASTNAARPGATSPSASCWPRCSRRRWADPEPARPGGRPPRAGRPGRPAPRRRHVAGSDARPLEGAERAARLVLAARRVGRHDRGDARPPGEAGRQAQLLPRHARLAAVTARPRAETDGQGARRDPYISFQRGASLVRASRHRLAHRMLKTGIGHLTCRALT